MRILLLTLLFSGSWYLLRSEPEFSSQKTELDDTIKVKISAPDRVQDERILTVHQKAPVEEEKRKTASVETTSETSLVSVSAQTDLEHVEEIQINDLEEGWNTELKDMLNRFEPADGDQIHKSYMEEQESYQTELEALMNEKHQKTSEEASLEVEQLIGQLDQRHQDKLREIFGAHYEAVKDGYERYMETARDIE